MHIDKISDQSDELMNKYLYVGLSRANLFLAVTIEDEFPEHLEYLSSKFKQGNWKEFKNK